MQIKSRKYPHPVLSPFGDDFVNCQFQATVRQRPVQSGDSYVLEVLCKTSSSDLVSLIKSGKACYACHFECSATRFRMLAQSRDEEFTVEIPSDSVEGKVEYCCFILAAEDIPAYRNADFHPDYGCISFRISKGDVLAVDCSGYFMADKNIDPLKKIPSIFTVAKNTEPDAEPMDIEATGNKVAIKLSEDNYSRYKTLSLNTKLRPALSTLIVLPALVFLLDEIKNGQAEAYEECRWFRVLSRKLEEAGIDASRPDTWRESAFCLAQKLIGDPLTRSLKALEEFQIED